MHYKYAYLNLTDFKCLVTTTFGKFSSLYLSVEIYLQREKIPTKKALFFVFYLKSVPLKLYPQTGTIFTPLCQASTKQPRFNENILFSLFGEQNSGSRAKHFNELKSFKYFKNFTKFKGFEQQISCRNKKKSI